jgi:hypothetical protein
MTPAIRQVKKLAFSGSRFGMHSLQYSTFNNLLWDLWPEIFIHGCCRGADLEAHLSVRQILKALVKIHVYPSTAKTQAPIPQDCDVVHERQDPLHRNCLIVAEGDELLVTPRGGEELRSGTWHAVRYARKLGRTIHIVWPNGSHEIETEESRRAH